MTDNVGRAHYPYPGLRSFESDEADRFFGRDQQRKALRKRLAKSRFVAVVGESGAGKSSLIRAGLIPDLEAGFVCKPGGEWRIAVMRPGPSPLNSLVDALLTPGVLTDEGGEPDVDFLLAELRRGPLGLSQIVKDAHFNESTSVLLVVDQFEELFRFCRTEEQKSQANQFVELILRASQELDGVIYVVLTMRSDFIGECARFRDLPEMLNDNLYLTPRLTREQIAEAIRLPAQVCGGSVDQDLTDRLCNEFTDAQDQLPLLQHLLMRLWRKEAESPNPQLTLRLYDDATKGSTSILDDHAQRTYDDKLPSDGRLTTDERKRVARTLFQSLVDPEGRRKDLRRDAPISEIANIAGVSIDEVCAVADAFRAPGRHFISATQTQRGELVADAKLDISHESLIRQWKSLREWADEEASNAREFRRLAEEARREISNAGELLTGRDLARALDWRDKASPTEAWSLRYEQEDGVLAKTLGFIEKSNEAEKERVKKEDVQRAKELSAERVRKSNQWLLFCAVGLVIAVFSTSIFGYKAFKASGMYEGLAKRHKELAEQAILESKNSKRQAELAGKAETDAKIFAISAQLSEHESEQSSIIAELARLEAKRERDKAVELKRKSDIAALEATAQRFACHATSAQKDPSTSVLALPLARLAVRRFPSDQQSELALQRALSLQPPPIAFGEVSPLLNYLPESNRRSYVEVRVSSASLTPDGGYAILPHENEAIVWNITKKEKVARHLHTNRVSTASFDLNGELVVSADANGNVDVWDWRKSKKKFSVKHDNKKPINDAHFSQDGTTLITSGDDETTRTWSTTDGAPLCTLPHPAGAPRGVFRANMSPDGKYIIALAWERSLGLWDSKTCQLVPIPDEGYVALTATFSPDGKWLGLVRQSDEEKNGDGKAVLSLFDTKKWEKMLDREFKPGATMGKSIAMTELAWSANSESLAVQTDGFGASIYPVELGSGRRVDLVGHAAVVTSIQFDPKGEFILTTSQDRTARLWKSRGESLVETRPRAVLTGYKDVIGSAAFSKDGSRVITASDDGAARSWWARDPISAMPIGSLQAAKLLDDHLVYVTEKGVFEMGYLGEKLGDARKLAERKNKLGDKSPLISGEALIVENCNGQISAWNAKSKLSDSATTQEMYCAQEQGSTIFDALWAPPKTPISQNGRFAATQPKEDDAKNDDEFGIWNLTSGVKNTYAFPSGSSHCDVLAVRGDGETVAIRCKDRGELIVYSPKHIKKEIYRHSASAGIRLARFSADGAQLAIGLGNNAIRLINLSSKKPDEKPKDLTGHTGRVTDMNFSSDGRLLVSVGTDRTMRLWNTSIGDEIIQHQRTERRVISASFSPDQRHILVVYGVGLFGKPGGVAIWRCHACESDKVMMREADIRIKELDRKLSESEERQFGITSEELNRSD